ncbi:hypothetical protein DL770_011261 [Monosporascus sp. CRB-9-2]|nr:hypothetical protein DL770_011261 [Monosporascus sp. CRB-9-2]
MHDSRAAIAPHRNADGVTGLVSQARQQRPRADDGIGTVEAGQAQAKRKRAEFVAAGQRILRHRAHALQAHQITMRLGGMHTGGAREIAERHCPHGTRERHQQLRADFDGLDARTVAVCARVFCIAIGGQVVFDFRGLHVSGRIGWAGPTKCCERSTQLRVDGQF